MIGTRVLYSPPWLGGDVNVRRYYYCKPRDSYVTAERSEYYVLSPLHMRKTEINSNSCGRNRSCSDLEYNHNFEIHLQWWLGAFFSTLKAFKCFENVNFLNINLSQLHKTVYWKVKMCTDITNMHWNDYWKMVQNKVRNIQGLREIYSPLPNYINKMRTKK